MDVEAAEADDTLRADIRRVEPEGFESLSATVESLRR
jgi:hypothetical protein